MSVVYTCVRGERGTAESAVAERALFHLLASAAGGSLPVVLWHRYELRRTTIYPREVLVGS